MTQTGKDKGRGERFLKCQGLPPADSFPTTHQGLFSVILEMDFPTGKVGVQHSLGAPALLGSPRLCSETQMVDRDVTRCQLLQAEGPGLMRGIGEGSKV